MRMNGLWLIFSDPSAVAAASRLELTAQVGQLWEK